MAERRATARKRPAVAEPSRSIGFELRKTDRAVEGDLQARLAGFGLQIGMWLYLRSLWFEDGLTQSELSRRVGTSKPTTLDQLRRMEYRGLIRLQRTTTDRRVVRVLLTPEGKALKAKLLLFAQLNHDAALAGFTATEIEALFDALRRIRHNVKAKLFSSIPRSTRTTHRTVERNKTRRGRKSRAVTTILAREVNHE
jgi:DNA-binding MarR family transcriptional regulator